MFPSRRSNPVHKRAGIYNSGLLLLMRSHLYNNKALPSSNSKLYTNTGGAVYNTGEVHFIDKCTLHDNDAEQVGRTLYNGGKMWYHLPAAMGYYLENVFECEATKCDYQGDVRPCEGSFQICPRRFAGSYMALIWPGALEDDLPYTCGTGYYGDSEVWSSQNSEVCSGICPSGSYCPTTPTTVPIPCPRDSYCNRTAAMKCPLFTHTENDDLHTKFQASERSCTADPSYLVVGSNFAIFGLWGIPGWASLVFLFWLARARFILWFNRVRSRNRVCSCWPQGWHAKPVWEVRKALRTVEAEDLKKAWKDLKDSKVAAKAEAAKAVAVAEEAAADGSDLEDAKAGLKAAEADLEAADASIRSLQQTCRIGAVIAFLSLPWLPSQLALWELIPLSRADPLGEEPWLLRRHRLERARERLTYVILLAGLVYPVWLMMYLNFAPIEGEPAAEYAFLWPFTLWVVLVRMIGSESCLIYDGQNETFVLQGTAHCKGQIEAFSWAVVGQAGMLLALANICIVVFCQLRTVRHSESDVLEERLRLFFFSHLRSFHPLVHKTISERVGEAVLRVPLFVWVAGFGFLFVLPLAQILSVSVQASPLYRAIFWSQAGIVYFGCPVLCGWFVYTFERHGSTKKLSTYALLHPTAATRAERGQCRFSTPASVLKLGKPDQSVTGLNKFMQGTYALVPSRPSYKFHLTSPA